MFWILRKSLSWALTLGAFVLLLILVLPGDYRRDVSIMIRAPRSKVYSQVRHLSQWNALAMFTDLTRRHREVPVEISEYAERSGGLDWLTGNRRDDDSRAENSADGISGYLPQLRITEARYPALLVYRVDGGPLPGVEPRVIIEEARSDDWKTTTRVTIREEYRFFGFWAGIKALSARFAAEKLHRRNLNKLRELCEEPEATASVDTNATGSSESGTSIVSGIPFIREGSDRSQGEGPHENDGSLLAGGTDLTAEKRKLENELAKMRSELERVKSDMNKLVAPREGAPARESATDPRRVIRRN